MDGQTLVATDSVSNLVEDHIKIDAMYESRLTTNEDTYVGIYLCVIYIMAFTLNLLVIYTCLRNWSFLIMSDMYIVSLASSDILLTVSASPFPIISSFSHKWAYGNTGCTLYGFLSMYFAVVSISTLAIMGVVRYISICHPHINVADRKLVFVTVSFPYIYALCWSLMPLTGMAAYVLESYGTSCTLGWDGNRTFITIMVVCCIFTPLIFIMFAYGQILWKIRGSNRNIRGNTKTSFRVARKQKFLIKIVFAMCFGFLLSWMPYAVVSLWSAYHGVRSIPMRIRVISVLLSRSSTVTNPIIYFLMSKKFGPLLLGVCWCRSCTSGRKHDCIMKKSNKSMNVNNVTGSRIVRQSHVSSAIILTGTSLISNQIGRNSAEATKV